MSRIKEQVTKEELTQSLSSFREAINLYGNQSNLAFHMGIARQTVGKFAKGLALIPLKRAIQIEQMTNGKIKRSQLRPDTF